MTIEERAREANPYRGTSLYDEYESGLCVGWDNGYIEGATEQKAIDEANPSDELIMRILNAIGYEEESWIPFVREHLREMRNMDKLYIIINSSHKTCDECSERIQCILTSLKIAENEFKRLSDFCHEQRDNDKWVYMYELWEHTVPYVNSGVSNNGRLLLAKCNNFEDTES